MYISMLLHMSGFPTIRPTTSDSVRSGRERVEVCTIRYGPRHYVVVVFLEHGFDNGLQLLVGNTMRDISLQPI